MWGKYYNIQVDLSACLGLYTHHVWSPYKPKTWGNVAIVCEHSVSACFCRIILCTEFHISTPSVLLHSERKVSLEVILFFAVCGLLMFAFCINVDVDQFVFITHIQVFECFYGGYMCTIGTVEVVHKYSCFFVVVVYFLEAISIVCE